MAIADGSCESYGIGDGLVRNLVGSECTQADGRHFCTGVQNPLRNIGRIDSLNMRRDGFGNWVHAFVTPEVRQGEAEVPRHGPTGRGIGLTYTSTRSRYTPHRCT